MFEKKLVMKLMIRGFLFVLIAFLSTNSKAQNADEFTSIISGFENKISFADIVGKNKIQKVTTTIGTIKKTAKANVYLWKVCNLENPAEATVTIFITNKKKYMVKYPVSLPEEALVEFSVGIKKNKIIVETLENQVKIITADTAYKVNQFTTEIKKKKGETLHINNTGNILSAESKEALKKFGKGDSIRFTDFEILIGCNSKPVKAKKTIEIIEK
jgi:hypothetical protein